MTKAEIIAFKIMDELPELSKLDHARERRVRNFIEDLVQAAIDSSVEEETKQIREFY